MKQIRKIFDVYIQKTKYSVYNIDGKEHEGYNDMPKTWWLYFDEKWAEGWEHPPLDSKHWVPFVKGIERHLWEFEIKQRNTYKIKWDDHRFSNNITVDMICNKKKIYSFGTFDMNFALSKLQYLMVVLTEHPYNFFDQQSELGRKIYYYGLPATIRPSGCPGEISIVPEYSSDISKEEWWNEYEKRQNVYIAKKAISEEETYELEMDKEDFEATKSYGEINWGDALSDGNINWFRS